MNNILNSGIIIRNPLRCSGRLVPYIPPPEFKYSKWLVDRRDRLIDSFYRKRIFRNRCIRVFAVGIAGCIVIGMGLGLTYLLWSAGALRYSNAGSWLGLNIGLATIAVGLYLDAKLMDYFPTESFWINIKKRRR